MKRIEYTIESSKVDSDKNIAICSDMHINDKTSNRKIEEILDTLIEINPTHIVILGDLYDVNWDDTLNNTDKVLYFIDQATKIADIFYVKGNMEQRSTLLPYFFYYNFYPEVHLLCEDNSKGKHTYFSNNGINFAGIKLPTNFYRLNEQEKTKLLLTKYKKYLEKLSNICGSENFNILLCHDPIIKDAFDYLAINGIIDLNFDLIISEHNHGGLMPKCMKPLFKLLNFNTELLSPTYTNGLFEIGNEGKNLIVSEGITKFHSDFGKLQFLEEFHEGTIENVKVLKPN